MIQVSTLPDNTSGALLTQAFEWLREGMQVRMVALTALIENPGAAVDYARLQFQFTGQNPLVFPGPQIPIGAAVLHTWAEGGPVREVGIADVPSLTPLPAIWWDEVAKGSIVLASGGPFNITEAVIVWDIRPYRAGQRPRSV